MEDLQEVPLWHRSSLARHQVFNDALQAHFLVSDLTNYGHLWPLDLLPLHAVEWMDINWTGTKQLGDYDTGYKWP